MPTQLLSRRRVIVAASILLLTAAGVFLLSRIAIPRPENQRPGKFPEELVFVRSEDDIVSGGVLFLPPKETAKPVAVIWIHGWGVNFYSPTYVGIGRSLAERGYATIAGNTRMHDLGNVAGWKGSKRIRGGGYWGVAAEEVLDIAAWIDFAENRGFRQVILTGHSAGWSAVRKYQAERQDPRVAGVVLASGPVRAEKREQDPDQLAQAKRLMAEGKGDDLIRDPKRSFPSFTSAATLLDIASTPPEFKDFFGTEISNPAVTRVRCPLLAFFGTNGDVGNQSDLDLLAASIKRHPPGPSKVTTVMIRGGDHMYTGQEVQVAEVIAAWADTTIHR